MDFVLDVYILFSKINAKYEKFSHRSAQVIKKKSILKYLCTTTVLVLQNKYSYVSQTFSYFWIILFINIKSFLSYSQYLINKQNISQHLYFVVFLLLLFNICTVHSCLFARVHSKEKNLSHLPM